MQLLVPLKIDMCSSSNCSSSCLCIVTVTIAGMADCCTRMLADYSQLADFDNIIVALQGFAGIVAEEIVARKHLAYIVTMFRGITIAHKCLIDMGKLMADYRLFMNWEACRLALVAGDKFVDKVLVVETNCLLDIDRAIKYSLKIVIAKEVLWAVDLFADIIGPCCKMLVVVVVVNTKVVFGDYFGLKEMMLVLMIALAGAD